MPDNLATAARWDGRRREWMTTLPRITDHLARQWAISIGEPFQPGGQTAWVAPVKTEADDDLVLKLAWRHPEAAHEGDALRFWDGQGAVRLYASEEFEDTMALLIERCHPGGTLESRPEEEQDTVVAALLPRLWSVPVPDRPFRPLQEMCELWADEFEERQAAKPGLLDPGLVREGIGLFRTLATTAERNVLLCTDLHAGNVLAARREPWLVIDPKPYVGDPTYDPLQHLLNCEERLRSDPVALARRVAGLLELDADRLLLWLFARCVQESHHRPRLGEVAGRIAPA